MCLSMFQLYMAVFFAAPTFNAVNLYTVFVSASHFTVGLTWLVTTIIYFIFKEVDETDARNLILSNKREHNWNTEAIVEDETI